MAFSTFVVFIFINGAFELLTAPGTSNVQGDVELLNGFFQTASLDVSIGVLLVLFTAAIGVVQLGSKFLPSGSGPRSDQLRMIRPIMMIAATSAIATITASLGFQVFIADSLANRLITYIFWSLVAAGTAIDLIILQLLSVFVLLGVIVDTSGISQEADAESED